MHTTVTKREHVNVNGITPAIADAAKAFLKLRVRPRIIESALSNAAILSMATINKTSARRIIDTLTELGWAFEYDAPQAPGAQTVIRLLVVID